MLHGLETYSACAPKPYCYDFHQFRLQTAQGGAYTHQSNPPSDLESTLLVPFITQNAIIRR